MCWRAVTGYNRGERKRWEGCWLWLRIYGGSRTTMFPVSGCGAGKAQHWKHAHFVMRSWCISYKLVSLRFFQFLTFISCTLLDIIIFPSFLYTISGIFHATSALVFLLAFGLSRIVHKEPNLRDEHDINWRWDEPGLDKVFMYDGFASGNNKTIQC